VGPRGCLDGMEKGNVSYPCRESSPDSTVIQLDRYSHPAMVLIPLFSNTSIIHSSYCVLLHFCFLRISLPLHSCLLFLFLFFFFSLMLLILLPIKLIIIPVAFSHVLCCLSLLSYTFVLFSHKLHDGGIGARYLAEVQIFLFYLCIPIPTLTHADKAAGT
jgi:hypothetical protein